MEVNIITLKGKNFSIYIKKFDTIGTIKDKIYYKLRECPAF